MRQEMVQRHLAPAEGHVAEGQRRHIDGQRTLIRQLAG
jgi:hypothetical protein